MKAKRTTALLVVVAAAVLAVLAGNIKSAVAAGPTITIWADQDRKAAVTQLANQWAAARGATANVVVHDFGKIRDDLGTVAAADAPDVIMAAHDWTGQLAANGLVQPIILSAATKKQFPAYTTNAFSYGTAVKKLYGVPTQIENIGLVVNTGVVKVPTTFKQLETEALAFKKKASGNLGIAVQQGANGDAYHMYPFFSGLGGYIFGVNHAGNLDASDIGVASKALLKNASLIDKWNREGLINSKVDSSTAQDAFLKGHAAFWITGPWNSDTLKKSGLKFKIIQLPKIAYPSVPFLGVQGFMVTKYAAAHGVESLAQDFVANYMSTAAAQTALANVAGRWPANLSAGKGFTDPVLAQFGRAAKGGVPMPNIPQMGSVWTDLGQAWVRSTKGAGASKAASSFKAAARAIADKIG
ncbi:MAG: arabinogalactan oligomer / maltooligosaccharide transport system substrate-binding protein [Actinomycetota bacterium]|nr:arabinogalactan oligomer / maltooligosaccharide transport system substrate-binding protein [Actinomycetota bacterium]